MKSPRSKQKPPSASRETKTGKPTGLNVSALSWLLTGRRFYVAFYLASFLLCFAVFKGLSNNYLFNDDFEWLASARYDMNITNVLTYRVIGFFRPVVNLSFFAMERIAPGNLPAYYYENIFLHFVNCMLVFHLMLALVRDRVIAATTAVFFMVTSVHCSAVMWISARTTLLFMVFLLLSLLVLVRPPWNRKKLIVSLVLYFLALATKETAVVGAVLVGLIYLFFRGERESTFDWKTVVAFAAVTIVYLVVRGIVIGRFVQPNWGPGVHVVRNIAGGAVYQLMPWSLDWLLALSRDLFGIGKPFFGEMLVKTSSSFWPEVLIIPMIAVLVLLSRMVKRQRDMLFAIAWMLIGLIPMSFLKFRFLTTASFAQNRYYYLASVGACLAIVLSLSVLWDHERFKRHGRLVAAALVAVLLVAETHRVEFMEHKWHDATYYFKDTVTGIVELLDKVDSYETCVVDSDSVPMRFSYLEKAVALERPRWNLVQVKNGREEAKNYGPCVFIEFERKDGAYQAKLYDVGG